MASEASRGAQPSEFRTSTAGVLASMRGEQRPARQRQRPRSDMWGRHRRNSTLRHVDVLQPLAVLRPIVRLIAVTFFCSLSCVGAARRSGVGASLWRAQSMAEGDEELGPIGARAHRLAAQQSGADGHLSSKDFWHAIFEDDETDSESEGEVPHRGPHVQHGLRASDEDGRRALYVLDDDAVRLQVFAPKIARGGSGSVYRGALELKGCKGHQSVAVKMVHQHTFESSHDFRERVGSITVKMSQEALDNPHIIRLLHSFTSRHPCHWFVMKLADFDFFNVLERAYESDPIEGLHPGSPGFIYLLSDVLEGLSIMHFHGYLHRDIKPENIVVVWDEDLHRYRAMIADLDFLCNVDAETPELQCGEERPGTMLYQPPEFWVPEPTHDREGKSDVFAAALTFLGITLAGPWGSRFEHVERLERRRREDDPAEVRWLVEEMADAAQDLLRAHGPFLRVLSRMVHPDESQRCTAEECLKMLQESIRVQGDALGDDAAVIPSLEWRLGEVWPMATDDVFSKFFRKLFRLRWP